MARRLLPENKGRGGEGGGGGAGDEEGDEDGGEEAADAVGGQGRY